VISLVRSGVRSDSRRAAPSADRLGFLWLAVPSSATSPSGFTSDMSKGRSYEDGSRSTYPTPRRVWISRGSLASIFRRSTDTYDSTIPVSPRKS
jgi:hypothetical protein